MFVTHSVLVFDQRSALVSMFIGLISFLFARFIGPMPSGFPPESTLVMKASVGEGDRSGSVCCTVFAIHRLLGDTAQARLLLQSSDYHSFWPAVQNFEQFACLQHCPLPPIAGHVRQIVS